MNGGADEELIGAIIGEYYEWLRGSATARGPEDLLDQDWTPEQRRSVLKAPDDTLVAFGRLSGTRSQERIREARAQHMEVRRKRTP